MKEKVTAFIKDPCAVCRVREVTSYCDFVISYYWTTIKNEQGVMIGPEHATCDLPMCDECRNKHGYYDFCDYHNKMLPDIDIKDEKLLKRRIRHQAKVIRDFQ